MARGVSPRPKTCHVKRKKKKKKREGGEEKKKPVTTRFRAHQLPFEKKKKKKREDREIHTNRGERREIEIVPGGAAHSSDLLICEREGEGKRKEEKRGGSRR